MGTSFGRRCRDICKQSECENGKWTTSTIFKLKLSERKTVKRCYFSYACTLKILNTFCMVLHMGESTPVHIRKGLLIKENLLPL